MTYLGKRPASVRQIPAYIDKTRLASDIEKLKDQALLDGARDSAIVNQKEIIFNPKLVKKVGSDNSYPSVHWPLFYPKDELGEAIDAFEWAVFFRMPTEETMPDYGGGPISDEVHRRLFLKTYQVVTDFYQHKNGFNKQADYRFEIDPEAVVYDLADVDPNPGKEILFFKNKGLY